MLTNSMPGWLKEMATMETEQDEPEPHKRLAKDVRLMAAQVAIFPELFDMLNTVHDSLPDGSLRLQVGALLARAWDLRK